MVGRTFGGHPNRIAAAAAALAVAAMVAWYLGSPLFIRTTLDEALPVAAAPAATAAVASAAAVTTAQPAAASAASATAQPAAAAVPTTIALASGQLGYVDGLHNGKGEVKLLQTGSDRVLRFDSVAITNAPDVHVYLSIDTGGAYVPANSVELGTLKATNGSFNYAIPADLDLARFRSVVVWCRAFSVLVTWADLVR